MVTNRKQTANLCSNLSGSPAVSVTRHLCISNILNNTDVRAIMRVLEVWWNKPAASAQTLTVHFSLVIWRYQGLLS